MLLLLATRSVSAAVRLTGVNALRYPLVCVRVTPAAPARSAAVLRGTVALCVGDRFPPTTSSRRDVTWCSLVRRRPLFLRGPRSCCTAVIDTDVVKSRQQLSTVYCPLCPFTAVSLYQTWTYVSDFFNPKSGGLT